MTEQPTAAHTDGRVVLSLSTGARICLILGALLLTYAAYLFWSPLGHNVSGGFPARCGSAANPPHDTLGKAVCGSVNSVRRAEALTALIAAIIVAGGGIIAFGVARVPAPTDAETSPTDAETSPEPGPVTK